MPVHLSQSTLDRIDAHCGEVYPHECCGALIGNTQNGVNIIQSAHPLKNSEPNNPERRFVIDPRDLNRLESDARKSGQSIVGFYHSHPDAPARPSPTDREWAWEAYSYIIVSVAHGEIADMRSFQLGGDGDEAVFVEESIVTI